MTFYPFNYNKIKVIVTGLSFFSQFRKDPAFLEKIREVLDNNEIDLVFIDYMYYGQYIRFFRRRGLKVIYGTHNVQSRIMWQKPADRIHRFVQYKLFYLSHFIHELIYFPGADRLLAVSEHDAKYYKKYIRKSKIVTLPNFIDEDLYLPGKDGNEDYIIMTGNFNAFQNETGIDWFLGKVWSHDLAKRIKLIIAGLGSKELFEKLSAKYNPENVRALGEQDDLKPWLKNARIAIVPLLEGSGTRLKCIEAMALKTQIISTPRGAEGIEHDGSILIAGSPGEFREQIVGLLEHGTDTTAKAYGIFMEKYSLSANRKIFEEMVSSMGI